MFWYLDNQNEKWKTSGIKDEDIFEVNFTPSEEEVDQEQRIRCSKMLQAFMSRAGIRTWEIPDSEPVY